MPLEAGGRLRARVASFPRRRWWADALVLAAAAAACGGPSAEPAGDAGGAYADVGARDPSGAVGGEAGTWSPAEGLPEPDEHLALGNAAYRSRDFTTALEQYEEAARLDPGAPAAWFGVYMAQQALGNEAAAEAALRRAEELDPGAPLAGSARSHSVNP